MQHYDSHRPDSSAAGDSLVQAASLKGRDRGSGLAGPFSLLLHSPVADLAKMVLVLSSTKKSSGLLRA